VSHVADTRNSLPVQVTFKSHRDPETKASVPKDLVVGEVAVFLAAGVSSSARPRGHVT